MRCLVRSLAFGLVFLNCATIASAADGTRQDSNSSPLAWVMLFLPVFLIVVMVFFVIRGSRKLSVDSIKASNEYRTFSEAHMRRLESQIESLDKKMIRIIELLEAVERGQRREHK